MAKINFGGVANKLANYFNKNEEAQNVFARAFYKMVGSGATTYDDNQPTYIKSGYNSNPIVYSIIQQMATKTTAVPYEVKIVKDETKRHHLKMLTKSAGTYESPSAYYNFLEVKHDAFEEEVLEMPLKRPNPDQTWDELLALYKTFIRTTGNAYFYIFNPSEGENKGVPMGIYILPSHLMNIVLKKDADLIYDESPIDHYRLISGESTNKFPVEDVIHVKFANPNFDHNGAHLYGMSPLRSALLNLNSSNEAIKGNVKMMQNSGSFGLIHGKSIPLMKDTADSLKDRLKEMDMDEGRLSNYAGISSEIAFTRLNLTTEELRPFDYLEYDQKQICNVLGWSDKLLNNDDGAKYDNVNSFRKQVITDNIMPDLELLAEAFNRGFFKRFKGYENAEIYFDPTGLPEMQEDSDKMVAWMGQLLDKGVVNRNEFREALRFPTSDMAEMEVHTVSMTLIPLADAVQSPEPFDNDTDPEANEPMENDEENDEEKAGFNPNQSRDRSGQWGSGGGADPEGTKPKGSETLKKQITSHNKEGGSTFQNGKDMAFKEGHYSVSTHLERTHKLKVGEALTPKHLTDFMSKNKDLFGSGDFAMGTWFNKAENLTVLDVSRVMTNREKAIKYIDFFYRKAMELGREHNQISIFDLGTMEEIDTGGTGNKN